MIKRNWQLGQGYFPDIRNLSCGDCGGWRKARGTMEYLERKMEKVRILVNQPEYQVIEILLVDFNIYFNETSRERERSIGVRELPVNSNILSTIEGSKCLRSNGNKHRHEKELIIEISC